MINMCMRQNNGINIFWLKRETEFMPFSDLIRALHHAAVQQQLLLIVINQITRTGDLSGGT